MIDLSCFIDLVDLFGGVEFNVPQDMFYDDPAQDLHIALNAGEQTLDGEQAMGLVRYRYGYTMADLDRVNVQRAFIQAAIEQKSIARRIFPREICSGWPRAWRSAARRTCRWRRFRIIWTIFM